ncbi:hypothetical protein BpHYR1_021186 [Brachionus plicatilis]|uniref:Uncharacterized protein n=1 Tax=Brachionus plicatilis TaxID=10195 RepID=A0A3M7TAH0_BRAPC|nr:hypothetical protein BpHYR1_021186 [Brachionus plicatilis]
MSSSRLIYSFTILCLFGIWLVRCENVLSEVHGISKEQEDIGMLSKRLKDMYILNQLRQLKSIRNNLAKFLGDDELQELDSESFDFSDERDKKSVMLPRIGRSPIVFPRIGSEKKRAVFQPRVGRNFDLYESEENDDSFLNEEKRIAFKPRIG